MVICRAFQGYSFGVTGAHRVKIRSKGE